MSETKELLRRPDGYEYSGESVMSNFDHEIDADRAEALKHSQDLDQYAGWNFCGYIWWDKQAETYHCEVWCYGSHVETFSGSLEEIMEQVCDEYGDE